MSIHQSTRPTIDATPLKRRLVRAGMTMKATERVAIRRTLEQTSGNRTEAAKILDVSVRTLQRKIKEFDLPF